MQYPSDFNDTLRRKPICGVLSVAMVANVSFAIATQAIKNNLMPFQKRHGGKTYDPQRVNALKELGINVKHFEVTDRMTLAAAIARYCRPGRTYSISTSRHVVTVRDGLVADQLEILPIEQHNSRRCIARFIIEVL